MPLSRRWYAWICALTLLQALVVSQFYFAHLEGTLTAAQMKAAGLSSGLPLGWHLGIWSDLLLLSPLLAFLAAKHFEQWGVRRILALLVVAVGVSLLFNEVWRSSGTPSAHYRDHSPTRSGVAHIVYMIFALTIVLCFYLPRTVTRPSIAIATSLALFAHLFFGSLIPLGIAKFALGLQFFPDQPFKAPVAWLILVAGGIALGVGCYRLLDHPGPGATTVLEKFDVVSRWVDAIALIGLIGTAFNYSTSWRHYLPGPGEMLSPDAWSNAVALFYAQNAMLPVALALTALLVYAAGRAFARKNIYQLRTLFTDDRTPTGIRLTTWWEVGSNVAFYTTMFLAIIALSRYLVFVAPIWCAFHLWALRFNEQQRREISGYLQCIKYDPPDTHPHREFILARRIPALRYLLDRPHDAREWVVAGAAILAFCCDLAGRFLGVAHATSVGYVVLISAALGNEVVVGIWRWSLNHELARSNAAQFAADRARDL